jgi:hypothetical protein
VISDQTPLVNKPPPPSWFEVPPKPAYDGDSVTYGEALDAYLATIQQRCEDPTWLRWYKRMLDIPEPEPVDLPPFPAVGDKPAWAKWWATYNARFAAAGASADGINDPPQPQPDPALVRKRKRFRRAVRAAVQREIEAAIPHVVAAAVEVCRGQ